MASLGSFFKGLGKGALNVASGGLLGPVSDVVGSLAGRANEQRAANRSQANQQSILQDQNRIGLGNLELGQKGFIEDVGGTRLGTARRADMIQNLPGAIDRANAGPRNISVPGGFTATEFGFDRNLIRPSQQTQDLAGLIRQGAMDRQMGGDTFQTSVLPTELQQPGKFDSILGGIAGGAGILGGVGKILEEHKERSQQRDPRDLTSRINGFPVTPSGQTAGGTFPGNLGLVPPEKKIPGVNF